MSDAVSIPLEANGQTSWRIEQAFPAADTFDFAGSVRCDVAGEGRFSAVALEMEPRHPHLYDPAGVSGSRDAVEAAVVPLFCLGNMGSSPAGGEILR